MAKCQAWQEPSLRSPQTQAGRGAECLKGPPDGNFARQPCSGEADNRSLLPDRLQQGLAKLAAASKGIGFKNSYSSGIKRRPYFFTTQADFCPFL
jgi:hypothetical protein